MRINYVIGTWNGRRIKPVANTAYYENVLKNHIKILNKTINSITQITVMRPYSGIQNSYYDIDQNDKIKIIDCENKYQSYGQWLKASSLFLNDFDYFIFIEDDYVPGTDNFDLKLIQIYEEGYYLCSKVFYEPRPHGSISNGILSSKTIEKALTHSNYDVYLSDYGVRNRKLVENGVNYQIAFSEYLTHHGILLKDYSDTYKVDFYHGHCNTVQDYSAHTVVYNEKIFTPIQTIIECK